MNGYFNTVHCLYTVNIIIFTNVITEVYDGDDNGKYYNDCY